MGVKQMVGIRGRTGKQALIDGDIMEVRDLIKIGNSEGVTLPKIWLQLLKAKAEKEGRELQGLGVRTDGDMAILKPYYGEDNGSSTPAKEGVEQ
jgi:hypothetical protein